MAEASERRRRPAKVEKKTVAVLYFENLSGGKEDEYFRDGMTEDIVTELSKIGRLEIYPRSEMLPFRDKPVTAPQVGEKLGAMYVLEGSIRQRREPLEDYHAAGGSAYAAFGVGGTL